MSEKSDVAKREEEILAFWRQYGIFRKSLEKDAPEGEFIFYDGPPFATGLPHYGHILAGTIKDAVPRYKTMRGFHVPRRWGWDCHGLPLENEIEKELGLSTKRDIEELGIERFNAAAREAVLRYADDWRKIVPRMGRWVDMERDYRTMDASYTESVWWAFKTLFDKGLAYKGFKAMHLCPRCGTTLSNFEVQQGYKDITDLAVTVKFELKDEPGTYLLAWTTTPWTLPGNMALAINNEVVYGKYEIRNAKSETEYVVVAKERAEEMLADTEHELVEEFTGDALMGKVYTPPFDYYKDTELEHKQNAWKVYHADYVSTDEGTGVVHIAPAFGEDDLALAQEHNLPIVHHVAKDGRFTEQVSDFTGRLVKPKDDPQSADVDIIKNLASRNRLFSKEKVTHAYPHCWRCDTPLLNYAAGSWFVRVAQLRDELVKENESIHWVPESVGSGRFGKWLEGARDWAISRSRYWGAPLPVWCNEQTGTHIVIGSLDDLKKHVKRSGNAYFVMRHAESESNVKGVISSNPNTNPLTTRGEGEARQAAMRLKDKNIDMIVVSPFLRTKQTAEIVAKELGLDAEKVIVDERLQEINLTELDGKPISAYWEFAGSYEERFEKAPEGGENLQDVKNRMGEMLYEFDRTYSNKTAVFITHEYPAWMLTAIASCLSKEETIVLNDVERDFIETGEVRELSFTPLPHNDKYELDFHRPYIDEVELYDGDTKLERVPDVFDCWFESGSMPYGQYHYPFENKDAFDPETGWFKKAKGFPADFIAEGLDQTRGWFYSLLVLGVGLFSTTPYRSVVVNGTVLAEDGKKMSKRLKNYPDPMDVVGKYGADALRFYLLTSPAVRAEDFNFSEHGVADVMRKNVTRLANVVSFYELYKDESVAPAPRDTHILDRWIGARLNALIGDVTNGMERYELDRATRPIADFIDDFSTWYVRRSRDRFKSGDEDDKHAALATVRHTLTELSKAVAPFMPFVAEYVYQKVRQTHDSESVHLAGWPHAEAVDEQSIARMAEVRHIVSLGLEARATSGIRVRQPLQELRIKSQELDEEFTTLIKDEVNVKDIVFDEKLAKEVELNTTITSELEEEGMVRDIIRQVQDLRKRAGFLPHDMAVLTVETDAKGRALLERFADELKRSAALAELSFAESADGEQFQTGSLSFTFSLQANKPISQ